MGGLGNIGMGRQPPVTSGKATRRLNRREETTVRVVLAHTGKIPPKVIIALNRTGTDFQRVNVSESDEAYFYLFAALWEAGKSFITVEHDIVVNKSTLVGLSECVNDWCSVPYPYFVGMWAGLGCAKFDASLMRRFPDLMADVERHGNATHPPRHWCFLDTAVSTELQRRGVSTCTAHEPVGHLGDGWPSHGCIPRPADA